MDRFEKQGFKLIHKPKLNGTYIYECPKGHKINHFIEDKPLQFKCPVCAGFPNTIAKRLNQLNQN